MSDSTFRCTCFPLSLCHAPLYLCYLSPHTHSLTRSLAHSPLNRPTIPSPRTGMSEISRADFRAKYEMISARDAKADWENNWGTAPNGSTKSAAEARSISHYLLVGDLLPVWQDVDQTYASMHEEGRDKLTVRLGRVTAGGGKRGLGGAAGAVGASAGNGASTARVKKSGSTTAGESDDDGDDDDNDDDEQEMATETESESEGVGKRQRQYQTDRVFQYKRQGPVDGTAKSDAPRAPLEAATPLTGVYLHSGYMSNIVRKLANKNRDDAAAILRKEAAAEAARVAYQLRQERVIAQAHALAQARAAAVAVRIAAAAAAEGRVAVADWSTDIAAATAAAAEAANFHFDSE